MGDANDIVDEVLDQVTGVSTDFVGAAKTATNWRTYTDINFYGMIAGVVPLSKALFFKVEYINSKSFHPLFYKFETITSDEYLDFLLVNKTFGSIPP